MATGEDQSEALVGYLLHVVSQRLERPQLLSLSFFDSSNAFASEAIYRLVSSGEDDPGTWIMRNSSLGPGSQGLQECVLNGVFGKIEAARRSDKSRDRPSRLTAKQAVDVKVRVSRGLRPAVGSETPGSDATRSCRTLHRDNGFRPRSPRQDWQHPAGSTRRAAPWSPQRVHP
jgi:hypothetical protein